MARLARRGVVTFDDLRAADVTAHGDRFRFERDNDRRSRWTAQGWTVLSFTPRQLRDHPVLVIARLSAALARAG